MTRGQVWRRGAERVTVERVDRAGRTVMVRTAFGALLVLAVARLVVLFQRQPDDELRDAKTTSPAPVTTLPAEAPAMVKIHIETTPDDDSGVIARTLSEHTRALRRIEATLHGLQHMAARSAVLGVREMTIVQDLQGRMTALTASVEAETSVNDAVLALINGQGAQLAALKEQLAAAIAAGADPAVLQEVVAAMDAATALNAQNAQKLVDAVLAGTPQAPDTSNAKR